MIISIIIINNSAISQLSVPQSDNKHQKFDHLHINYISNLNLQLIWINTLEFHNIKYHVYELASLYQKYLPMAKLRLVLLLYI